MDEVGEVAREGAGERGRLADLYRQHADAATRLAYLLTGDRALAEDLVQEAFVRLARRLTHLRDPEAFGAYLRKTIVNLANSHFRRRRVERVYLEKEASLRARTPAVADAPDVGTREEMRTALFTLPARQRAALVLRFYEDLPDERIAEILGCRRSTVRTLVRRGVVALRGELGGEEA